LPLNNMSGSTVILTGRDLPLKNFAVTLLVLILSQLPSAAQQEAPASRHHGSRSLAVFQITEAPVLDGLLNEQAWKDAAVAGEFVQKDPNEGMPATERTEVRVLYDSENLYFGVSCFDGQAGRFWPGSSDGTIALEMTIASPSFSIPSTTTEMLSCSESTRVAPNMMP